MLTLLAIYTAVLARQASYAVGGSDSSGYANMARSLLKGSVRRPIPELDQFDLPASQAQIFTPLAYLPRQEGGAPTKTMVPFYPVGFPIHLAVAAIILGWQSGPYLVSPLLGTLGLLFLYLIGLQLGLSRAFAFAGALILAANPTFIFMALQPMSDVTALFWALVMVWAGLRSRQNDKWALLAGAAFGVAFLVRPTNVLLLAPLAFCLRLKPKVILLFMLGGLPLAAIFFAYNFAAFGNLLQTGYGAISLQEFVTTSGLTTRFKHYLFWVMMTMSPLLLVGWAGVAADRRVEWRDRALLIAWFGVFIIFYACYSVYDAWWYTRFLLPAYPALILGALLTTRDLPAVFPETHRRLRLAAGLALLAVALGFAWHYDRVFEVFRVGKEQAIHAESSRWAGARLPAQSVVVASEMSGALKFYTDHLILRWDWVPPEAWPLLKNRVQERGYQFYALLMPHEVDKAQQRVPGIWSEQGRLRNITLWRIKPLDKAPPSLNYVSGFFDPEQDEQGRRWRWMSDEGVVELENTGRTMRLLIEGDVPVNVLPRPVTIRIVLNGQVLAQVEAKEAAFRKELIITPAQQGSGKLSELQLGTNQVFVPSQLDPRNSDQRRLGFSLTKLTWEE
jgi:4-amino-4-deoxy-L-arabinose transferase-like glycosyltransferase